MPTTWPRARVDAEQHGAEHEHQHGRRAARDRVHDRQRHALVGGREQGDVRQLQQAGDDDVRHRGPLDVPHDQRRPAGTAPPTRSGRRRSRPGCRAARTISRFHVACRTAAASARASAVAGNSGRVQRQHGDAVALDRRGGPVQLAHPACQPVLDLVVVRALGRVPGLAAADASSGSRRGRRGWRRSACRGRSSARPLIGVGDRLRRRPDGVGLAGQREAGRAGTPARGRAAPPAGGRATSTCTSPHVHPSGSAPRPPLELDAGAREALRRARPASVRPSRKKPSSRRSSAASVPGTVRLKNSSSGDSSEKPTAPRNRSSSSPASAYSLEREVAQQRRGDRGAGRGGAHLAVPAAEHAERAPLDRRSRRLEVAEQVAQAHQRQRADVGLDPRQVVRPVPLLRRRAGRRSAARGTGSATRSRSGAGSRRPRSGCWRSRSCRPSGSRQAGSSSYGTVPTHGSVVGNRPSPLARRGTGPPHIWYPISPGQRRVDAVQRRAADAAPARPPRRRRCGPAPAPRKAPHVPGRAQRRPLQRERAASRPAASGVTTGPCAVVTTSCSIGPARAADARSARYAAPRCRRASTSSRSCVSASTFVKPHAA